MKKILKEFGKQAYLALTGGHRRTEFCIHGVRVHIPTEIDTRIRFFIARQRYENAEAALVRQHIQKGEAVIELGGALGVISAVIRDQIGPEGNHIVVEPNPTIVETCRRNAGTSPNTTIIHAALAYGTSEVTLSQDTSLLDNRVTDYRSGSASSFTVAAITLAKIQSDLKARFTLVCDIEGMEGDLVIKDANALSQCDKIIMEVHPAYLKERGTSLDALLQQLTELGFTKVSLAKNALFMRR